MKNKQTHYKDEILKKMEEDIISLDTSIYEYKSKLRDEKEKNAKLAKELAEAQEQIKQQKAFIKKLKMKAASLKMGIFGNGKEFQTWLTQELDKQTQK